ncbi:MAG: tetratricopeptide repeat protein [Thermoplasmata archaeon]
MEIQLDNLKEFLIKNEKNVMLFSGPEGLGKKTIIKNYILKKKGKIIEFEYEKGKDNNQLLLEGLGLNETFKKYLSVINTLTPGEASKKNDIIYSLIQIKFEELKKEENLYIIFYNLENIGKNCSPLLFFIISNFLKEDVKSKIFLIYNNNNRNTEFEGTVEILKTMGMEEIILQPYSKKSIKKILQNMEYKIPEMVVDLIYEKAHGNLGVILNSIKILEDRNYIIEKTFIKPLTEKTINEINNLLMGNAEEIILEKLSPDEMVVLIYLSLLNEKIEAMKLMDLVNLKEENFVNAVDNLIRKKIVKEEGDFLELRNNELENQIEKSFSNLRISDARVKIAKYLEGKGDFYRSGIQYYYANNFEKAYENLSKAGLKFYEDGDLYNAQNAFSLASSIRTDDKEIILYLIDILKEKEDFSGILNLTKKIFEKDPDNFVAIINQAEALFRISEYEEAKKYYDLALEKAKNQKEKAQAELGLGKYYYNIENLNESEKFLKDAIKISKDENDFVTEENALRILGNIEYERKNYPKALSYYEKSREISENIKNLYDLAAAYNNIGNVSAEIDISKGKYFYSKALEIAEKFWYPSLLETLFLNLAILDEYDCKIKEAINLFQRSLGISIARKNYDTALIAIVNLFEPFIKMGRIEDAKRIVSIGLDVSNKIGKQYERIEIEVFGKMLNIISGKEENIIPEIEKLKKSGIKTYVDYANSAISTYYFYLGEIKKSIDLYWDYLKGKIGNLTIDDIMDYIEYLEILAYEKFFKKGVDQEFLELVKNIEENDSLKNVNFAKCRFSIIKSIIDIENKNRNGISSFQENIKNIGDQDLKYLSARLKITFGLYLAKNFNDNTILDEGKKELISLNLKGTEKALNKAFSYKV